MEKVEESSAATTVPSTEGREPLGAEKSPSLKKVEEKMTLSKFFDIIGQIDIILRTETSVRYEVIAYPFNGVAPGELTLSSYSSLPMSFGVFVSGDNDIPWIYTKFEEIGDFSSFDEFLGNSWRRIVSMIDCATKILICPPSTVWNGRNPDPDRLGFPISLILDKNAMVHDIISNITGIIMLRD